MCGANNRAFVETMTTTFPNQQHRGTGYIMGVKKTARATHAHNYHHRASEQQISKKINGHNLKKQDPRAQKTGLKKQKVRTAQVKAEQRTQTKPRTIQREDTLGAENKEK